MVNSSVETRTTANFAENRGRDSDESAAIIRDGEYGTSALSKNASSGRVRDGVESLGIEN